MQMIAQGGGALNSLNPTWFHIRTEQNFPNSQSFILDQIILLHSKFDRLEISSFDANKIWKSCFLVLVLMSTRLENIVHWFKCIWYINFWCRPDHDPSPPPRSPPLNSAYHCLGALTKSITIFLPYFTIQILSCILTNICPYSTLPFNKVHHNILTNICPYSTLNIKVSGCL